MATRFAISRCALPIALLFFVSCEKKRAADPGTLPPAAPDSPAPDSPQEPEVPNTAPSAAALSLSTSNDVAANIDLSAADAEGDALFYEIVTPPEHGSLSGAAPNLVYTPHYNWWGSDSFVYRSSDGKLSSEPATVSISVSSSFANAADQVVLTPSSTPLVAHVSGGSCGSSSATASLPITVANNSKFKVLLAAYVVSDTVSCPGATCSFGGGSADLIELNPGETKSAALNAHINISDVNATGSYTATAHLTATANVLSDPGGHLGLASKSNLSDSEWSNLFVMGANPALNAQSGALQGSPRIRYQVLSSAAGGIQVSGNWNIDLNCPD